MATNYPVLNSTPYPARFSSTTGLSWVVVIGLGILAVGYVIEIVAGAGQLADPGLSLITDAEGGVTVWDFAQSIGLFVRGAIFLLNVIVFLIWIHRSYTNLAALQGQHLEFSSGWAVGWWFIPIAFLFKPFQVVREIWRESDPAFDPNQGFRSEVSSPALLGWWWFFWITGYFFNNITWRVFDPDNKAFTEISAVLFIVTGFLCFGAALLAMGVVRNITKRQEERFTVMRSHSQRSSASPSGYGPPPPPVFGESH